MTYIQCIFQCAFNHILCDYIFDCKFDTFESNCLFDKKIIGMSGRRSSQSAFGRSTGNDVNKHNNFLVYSPVFPPQLSTFIIKGVLKSKNLFSESCLERPNLGVGVDTFPDPVSYFGAPCLKLRFEKFMQCVRINV